MVQAVKMRPEQFRMTTAWKNHEDTFDVIQHIFYCPGATPFILAFQGDNLLLITASHGMCLFPHTSHTDAL